MLSGSLVASSFGMSISANAFPITPNRHAKIKRWRGYARGFSKYAIGMGGVMIKLGQFASTRADILPEEVVLELENLQDEVPSVKYEAIQKVIEAEIGQNR